MTANFFELGGHSLLAARLSASIERTFGAKLPLATFIKAATIERQARLLRDQRTQTEWPSLVPIRASGSKPPLFCVHLRGWQRLELPRSRAASAVRSAVCTAFSPAASTG